LTGNATTTLETDFVANLWERISEEPKKASLIQMNRDREYSKAKLADTFTALSDKNPP
jgi:hypothetical protein